MCFSAKASFIAASGLGLVGVATVLQARDKKILPFAASPLLFGFQQALEGIVWLTMHAGGATTTVAHLLGTYGFTFFAGTFWPIWIPLALYIPEKNQQRKKILKALLGIGALIGSGALLSCLLLGVVAQTVDHHIIYRFRETATINESYASLFYILWWVLYALPTIVSFFVATLPGAWLAGLLIAVAFIAAQLSYHLAFGSVWCYFAAVISVIAYAIVALYKRRNH